MFGSPRKQDEFIFLCSNLGQGSFFVAPGILTKFVIFLVY